MPNQYVDLIEDETGTRIFHFSHMTYGEYRADLVIEDMRHNLETLVEALLFASKRLAH
jgi:zinc transport system substrate-binding protein